MALGDRIVVMEHGRVAQVGKPRDIYQRPATRFVADFIGTMNRLTGTTRGGVFSFRAGDLAWAHAPAAPTEQIGSASSRERESQYGSLYVVARSFNKKQH